MLNPNFLLAHRNKYSEGMEDGQKVPRGLPDFNSYVKILHMFIIQMDGQTDRQRHTLAARGLEELFPVVLLCQFLVLVGNRFLFYILMDLEYNTVMVLC